MPRRLAALILLATLMSVALVACSSDTEPAPTAAPPTPTAQAVAPTAAPSTPSQPPDGTVVSLQDPGGSGSYIFSPSEFTFSVGETVMFTLTSEKEFHTFTVDDLGIDEYVNAGETVTLTFTFDTPGTSQILCLPHAVLGMLGTIPVP